MFQIYFVLPYTKFYSKQFRSAENSSAAKKDRLK